jgi:hypothetical protein
MLWAPTVTEELRNDVRFALRFKVGRKQQPLTDQERDMVAAAIVEHSLSDLQRNAGRYTSEAHDEFDKFARLARQSRN